MGEFKKLIKECFGKISAFDETIICDDFCIFAIINEAKKEFVWRHIVNDLIEGKGYWSEYDIKVVAKWFVKWFGDDET